MEDINNFKILNQKMKTRSLLYPIKDEINNYRKLFIESAHTKKDCYQIPFLVILKTFG